MTIDRCVNGHSEAWSLEKVLYPTTWQYGTVRIKKVASCYSSTCSLTALVEATFMDHLSRLVDRHIGRVYSSTSKTQVNKHSLQLRSQCSHAVHVLLHQWHGMPCLFHCMFLIWVIEAFIISFISFHLTVALFGAFMHRNFIFFSSKLGPRHVNRHLLRRGVQNWHYSEQGRVLPDTSSGGPLASPYEWRNMQRCMPWRWEATRQRHVDVMMWCQFPRFFRGCDHITWLKF